MLKRAGHDRAAERGSNRGECCCGLPLAEEEEETRRKLFLQANVTEGMKMLGDGTAWWGAREEELELNYK